MSKLKEWAAVIAIIIGFILVIGYDIYSNSEMRKEINRVEIALTDKIHDIDMKVVRIDERTELMEERMGNFERRMFNVEERMWGIEYRVTNIEHHLYGRDFNQRTATPSDHVVIANQTPR